MFKLFGFPVQVQAGFLIFLMIVVGINQNAVGLWMAGGIAVFTLLHELGHAIAARSAGANASISLSFMAGYTSYSTKGIRISHARQALISAAGPATQIAVSVGILVAMGVNPSSSTDVRSSAAALGIWWAGPVIGLLNLFPVLPLDGGHLVQSLLEAITRKPMTRPMVYISLGLTGAVGVWMVATGRRDLAVFVVFLVYAQLQMLSDLKPADTSQPEPPPPPQFRVPDPPPTAPPRVTERPTPSSPPPPLPPPHYGATQRPPGH